MIVAIDGPAGSGKSTTAHAIADRCHLTFLDTGAMYRSVTYKCLSTGVDVNDEAAVVAVAKAARIDFGSSDEGQTVFIDGEDVTRQIRTPEVDRNVSVVSAYPGVRAAMVARQRELGSSGDVVAEGRDIGTVVFPDAEVKVFLTADAAARAHRRAVQREGGDAGSDAGAKADAAEEKAILDDLVRRDQLDSTRKDSPLKPAEDAHILDNSDLTPDQVVERIVALMDEVRSRSARANAPFAPAQGDSSEVPARPTVGASKARASRGGAGTLPRLRAFQGNSFDDYFDRPMRDFPRPGKMLAGLAVGLCTFVTKILWPWKIERADLLWDDKSSRVIVMNHTSMLDPVIVFCSGYLHGMRIRTVYKDEFNKAKVVTWAFSRFGGFPVKRGTADMSVMRRAKTYLRNGECILIYPEGTRIKSDDQEVKFHGGFAIMAQMGRVPVQPLAIVGARDITPVGKHYKRLGRVFLRAGECIGFDDLGVKGRKGQAVKMEEVAMERVYALRDELRREHPGKM